MKKSRLLTSLGTYLGLIAPAALTVYLIRLTPSPNIVSLLDMDKPKVEEEEIEPEKKEEEKEKDKESQSDDPKINIIDKPVPPQIPFPEGESGGRSDEGSEEEDGEEGEDETDSDDDQNGDTSDSEDGVDGDGTGGDGSEEAGGGEEGEQSAGSDGENSSSGDPLLTLLGTLDFDQVQKWASDVVEGKEGKSKKAE